MSLTYENYCEGNDCVRVKRSNNSGDVFQSEYIFDVNVDSDKDGLADFNEIKIGTDRYNEDSDFDGLNDYLELYYNYSPLLKDSDSNLINDGDEDYDKDKMKN